MVLEMALLSTNPAAVPRRLPMQAWAMLDMVRLAHPGLPEAAIQLIDGVCHGSDRIRGGGTEFRSTLLSGTLRKRRPRRPRRRDARARLLVRACHARA